MIVITVDGMNWKTASEVYKDTFHKQSMKMIKCNVRMLTSPYGTNATPPGLVTLWSGINTKKLHSNIFRKSFEDGSLIEFIDINGNPLDMVWNHFNRSKLYEKCLGPNPYKNNEVYWKHYQNLFKLNVKFVSCEEMCIFSESIKKDYDLFWIHTSIVKSAVMVPSPYEGGRIPSLIPYDTIRKDKSLKKEVYMMGIRRYREVIKYLAEMNPDQSILITSDHGTLVDLPYSDEQIDEIPLIVNREVDLSDVNYQWDIKNLILRLK